MGVQRIVAITVLLFIASFISAQTFNVDDQYNQAMKNAKMAQQAQQYSQAVHFYREALSLKPNELLPKYKIEDIRTIYIKDELDSLKKVPVAAVEKPKVRQSKKEVAAEQVLMQKLAEEKATQKMNEEVELVKQELEQIIQTAEFLNISDTSEFELDNINISDVEPDRESGIGSIENLPAEQLNITQPKTEKSLTISERPLPKVKQDTITVVAPEKQPEVKAEKPIVVVQQVKKEIPKQPEPNTEWISKENERLLQVYPNIKTVEEIDMPSKHITKVIMNTNNKVVVYLKVKHSWGATFFFVDEVGLDPKSISETYFNIMTNINTYEH